jgi:hypothetical protein
MTHSIRDPLYTRYPSAPAQAGLRYMGIADPPLPLSSELPIKYFMHRSLTCSHNKRHLSQARTAIPTKELLPTEELLKTLKRNPEIDAEDAKNELRWMKQSLPDQSERTLSLLVERRAKGEPLQYILGELDASPLPADNRLNRLWSVDAEMPSSYPNSSTRNGTHIWPTR